MSTAIHAALLGIAVSPATTAHFSRVPRAVGDSIQYVSLPLGASEHDRTGRAHRASRGALRAPQMGPIDLSFALTLMSAQPSLAALDLPNVADTPDTLWSGASGESPFSTTAYSPGPGGGGGVASDSVAYVAAAVEKEAAVTGDNPKPIYPYELVIRMVEAKFSVNFVVDTTGRIDTTTIEVPPSVHVQFAKAVRDVLVRWHFFPAEIRGHRVRQLMEQPFEFRIVRGQLAGEGQ